MLVEALLHQVAERDRVESNFATGDADELPGSKKQAAGPRKSWHEWYKELTVNLAMGERDSDEWPDTKGNMRGRRESLCGWFHDQASLSSDERASDSDEKAQATSLAPLLKAFNAPGEKSKLHQRLVARIDDLDRRLSMSLEARQERADKVEGVICSDPTKVQVAPTTAEIAEAVCIAAYR